MSDYIYLDHIYDDTNEDLTWGLYYQLNNGNNENTSVPNDEMGKALGSSIPTIEDSEYTYTREGYDIITKGIWNEEPLSGGADNSFESDSGSWASDVSEKFGGAANMIKSGAIYKGSMDMASEQLGDLLDSLKTGKGTKGEDLSFFSKVYNGILSGINQAQSSIVSGVEDLAQKAINYAEGGGFRGYLKGITTGNYITTIDAMKVFKGSKVSLGLPKLSTRLWYGVPAKGKTPIEQLDWIIDKVVGDDPDRWVAFGGIQQSPNKYVSRYSDYVSGTNWDYSNQPINGTYAVRLGTRMIISNLIVTSFDFEYSKLYTNTKGYNGPLYIDVNLELDHAFYQGKDNLRQLINKGLNYSGNNWLQDKRLKQLEDSKS